MVSFLEDATTLGSFMLSIDRSKIVITTRRVPKWPLWQDPRIRFIALDFLKPADELVQLMKPLCHDVTHAFFASYVHDVDFAKLKNYNVPLFQNFLLATDQSSKSLQRVILHTGGKVRELLDMGSPMHIVKCCANTMQSALWSPSGTRGSPGS